MSDIPFWVTFHFEWLSILSDITFWVTFHLRNIPFWVTFHFEGYFILSDIPFWVTGLCLNLNDENCGGILRFILPCKRDCQPIFFKKQGIYQRYAKLWLLRPLIKNIPDSSHQYGSNVTFGASLASQMREEYVFEKKIFWKLDLKGGK